MSDGKPPGSNPTKRSAGEPSESDSQSSSHLSKRRKYSTEPSETYNLHPSDAFGGLKALNESLKFESMILFPNDLAKARENFRIMSDDYAKEKVSRKETFEAALKRATRRANDADHKLQDVGQAFADKLKARTESHAEELEKLLQENQSLKSKNTSLIILEAATREALKLATEAPSLRSALVEKEAQLALFDQTRVQMKAELVELASLHGCASAKYQAMQAQHQLLMNRIDQFNQDLDDKGMKTIVRCGIEIQEESQVLGKTLNDANGDLVKVRTRLEAASLLLITDVKEASEQTDRPTQAEEEAPSFAGQPITGGETNSEPVEREQGPPSKGPEECAQFVAPKKVTLENVEQSGEDRNKDCSPQPY